jgi:hypothetical protein
MSTLINNVKSARVMNPMNMTVEHNVPHCEDIMDLQPGGVAVFFIHIELLRDHIDVHVTGTQSSEDPDDFTVTSVVVVNASVKSRVWNQAMLSANLFASLHNTHICASVFDLSNLHTIADAIMSQI